VLRGAPIVHRTLTVVAAALKRRGLTRVADASRRAWCAAYERLVPRAAGANAGSSGGDNQGDS
jgi:hypothetical protein